MLNVLSLFSGIGAFEKALENLNIDHEVVGYCEIDKYASKAYSEDWESWYVVFMYLRQVPSVHRRRLHWRYLPHLYKVFL